LSYSWTQTAGDMVKLSSTTDPIISFNAPPVNVGQVKLLRFGLSVNDGHGGIDYTSINVIVIHLNRAPIVTVTTPLTVNEGSQVTLSATVTNPDNDVLSFAWKQTSGQPVVLSSSIDENPTFTAPAYNAAGNEIKFQVDVTDGLSDVQSCDRPSVTSTWNLMLL